MKVTRAKGHLSEAEIDQRISKIKDYWRVRRWLIIRHALVDPSQATEIGKRFNVSKQMVSNLVSNYNRNGEKALESKGRGQRQKAYMNLEKEALFLKTFTDQAEKGSVITVQEIQEAFEKKVGNAVSKSTVYRLLKRHSWRKIKPRPAHAKADKEKQASFKKTSKIS